MRFLKSLLVAIILLTGTVFTQDFRTVHDGLEYAEVSKEISGKTVKMNLLRLDLSKVRLDVVHAMDAAIGVETTSSIATRHKALAAVNAGFFRLDNSLYAGDAAGAMRIDGVHYSEPVNDRVALFIINDLKRMGPDKSGVHIDRLTARYALSFSKDTQIEISGINRERKENEIIYYGPEFHRSTLTAPGGTEIIVRRGKIVSINERGSTEIPHDGFVISANGTALIELLKHARIGRKVLRTTSMTLILDGSKDFYNPTMLSLLAEDIVAGIPQLIKNGKIDITWELEKTTKAFVETRHPRTAAAKLNDGKFLLITVDGRSEISGGIGLQDLAEYLLSLGAVDAMNLDGGGSTTMWLDGKVMNKPSDKEGERKVSDALIIRKR